MNLLWKKGFMDVSVKELADAMEIKRSSFYNSFGSREAVFREALETYRSHAPNARLADIREGEPVIPALVSVLRDMCHDRAIDKDARGCLMCNSIAELGGLRNKTGKLVEQEVIKQTSVAERLLSIAVEQKEIPAVKNVKSTAGVFMAFITGINVLSKVEHDEARLWETCKQFLRWLGVPEALLE